jgi:hypothetical protein
MNQPYPNLIDYYREDAPLAEDEPTKEDIDSDRATEDRYERMNDDNT